MFNLIHCYILLVYSKERPDMYNHFDGKSNRCMKGKVICKGIIYSEECVFKKYKIPFEREKTTSK